MNAKKLLNIITELLQNKDIWLESISGSLLSNGNYKYICYMNVESSYNNKIDNKFEF